MTPAVLSVPERLGTRDQVRDWLSGVPQDLSAAIVQVDCAALAVGTPSFVDELIKIVITERHAAELHLVNASERTQVNALRSAGNRRVADRVQVTVKEAPSGFLRRLRRS